MSSSNPGLVTVRNGWGEGDGNHGDRLTLLVAVMNHAALTFVSMVIAWLTSGRLYCCSSFFSLGVGKGRVGSRQLLTPCPHPLPCVAPADSGSGDPARHRGSAQDGRHGDAAVLRRRGRLRQHLRTHHQRRGAAVGRDAHLRRYVTQSARFSLTP